jgi:hypothetical protein
MNKERITVALCTNAAGSHKLPLFVIGRSAKPRVLKNVNLNALPVYYKAQKSDWMDPFLFREWSIHYAKKTSTTEKKSKKKP